MCWGRAGRREKEAAGRSTSGCRLRRLPWFSGARTITRLELPTIATERPGMSERVVLDIVMPRLNGVEAAHHITRACPGVGVILLTMHTEDHYVLDAIRDGVRGFVIKTQAAEDLFQAIREVGRGGMYVSPGISAAVVQALRAAAGPRQPLTHRERGVLQLLVEGKGTKQIAGVLEISVKTAEFHRTRIMKKLDIHETAGLVRYAIRTGLIEP